MAGTRPKLMHLAVALMAATGIGASQQYNQGVALQMQLENHFRGADRGKPSRAAHYKRLAKKRANIRARSKK